MLRYTLAADGNLPGISADKTNSIGSTSLNLGGQVNPSAILNSTTFEVEVYQNVADGTGQTTYQIFKVDNCRITSRSGGVNKRGIYEETFNFVGVLSYDDVDNKVKPSGLSGSNVV